MPILTNIILPYNGTNASIPALWSRVTGLDGKVKKAWGAEAVGTSGGSDTHSHTSSTHTHTPSDSHGHNVSYNASGQCDSYGGTGNNDPIAQCNHNHASSTITTRVGGDAASTVAYPSTSLNNLPPFHEVIYVKASAGASLKQNHIVYHTVNETPTGWNIPDGNGGRPDIRNRYLRGAGTGADAGTQGGSFTHTHDLTHSHSTSHSHTGVTGIDDNHPNRNNAGGSGGNRTGSHDHPVTLNATSVTTDTYSGSVTSGTVEPTYYKLLALLNSGTGAWKKGMIAMWEDSSASIPPGWLLCDGRAWTNGLKNTPDLRDKYIKVANDGTEIGNTGGSNTHSHAASNSHSHTEAAAHSHTGSTGAVGNGGASGPGGTSPGSHTHSLASVGNNSATLTWNATTMTGESVSNQPAYKTIYFIQLEKVGSAGVMLNFV